MDKEVLHLDTKPVLLTVNPWSHAYGCVSLIRLIGNGAKVVYMPKFDVRHFLAAIQVIYVAMYVLYHMFDTLYIRYPDVQSH